MNLAKLPYQDEKQDLHVVVETPRGSHTKIAYDPERELFRYSRPLVLGVTYPYDWGFVPSTVAPDGDPLDALIYHDGTSFPGLVIACKPIGLVELSQAVVKDGRASSERQSNDRLIVVPAEDERARDATLFSPRVRQELEQFFLLATLLTPKDPRIEGWKGPEVAAKLVADAHAAYRRKEAT
ncbi:inorganic diphosphatase [Pendulispora albinea]|uniref:inorganic diphosphatase n=1 Tax=Pendulispora albinea TaxID=2741071 RepID=A0ABZ2LNX6_9BACT